MSVRTDRHKRSDWKRDGRGLRRYGAWSVRTCMRSKNNGERLPMFAKDNKLALTNTFFSTRKGVEYLTPGTVNAISSRNGQKRIDYILTDKHTDIPTRQAHRYPNPTSTPISSPDKHTDIACTSYDLKVHPRLSPGLRLRHRIRDGSPRRSFRTQQTRANEKHNPAFRSAEVYIRRALQTPSS